MKVIIFSLFFGFFAVFAKAQEMYLIEETDSIQLYETFLSNTSKGNIFPALYNNGLLYVAKNKKENYQLFFTNLQSQSIEILLKNRFTFGAASAYNNEIYFTGISKKIDKRGNFNNTIYKANIENFKISTIEKLPFCDRNYSYTDPFISKNGKQLVFVTNEKEVLHILEYVKNEANEWEKKSVVFISHPNFDIINPTIFNENTIYFSTNIFNGEITGVSYTTNEKGEIFVDKVKREEGDFNIYKIERKGEIWGIPIKANEFNSEFDELGVIFETENSGFLTSFRYNSNDNIYYFILK
jgi:hypothetical protein